MTEEGKGAGAGGLRSWQSSISLPGSWFTLPGREFTL